jgi:hypothetical protein
MTFTRINSRLSFGDQDSCANQSPDTAIIHACKEPCHRDAVVYTGKISPSHKHYLAHQTPGHLYLNIIDPPLPLFQIDTFRQVLKFFDDLHSSTGLHIHCNQGQSRAPSLALLIMSKRMHELPSAGYSQAKESFARRFPYRPGKGIETFLTQNWDLI